MNHVPTELLHETFIKLVLEDRLECMLVCRRWYDIVNERSLLHTLVISDHKLFFNLKEMIKHQPYRAAQVEILTIYSTPRLDFDKRILCNMFPNLREIISPKTSHYYNPFHLIHPTSRMDLPFQFINSSSKLNKITDFGECELAHQLIRFNMCQNLKSIDLDFLGPPGTVSKSILSQLKNMPVLETLALQHSNVKLMDLEMVHHNLPALKSLCISYIHIASGEVPHDVIPAMLIKKLNLALLSADNLNTHIEFYKYLTMKYPTVNKPIFDDSVISRNNRDTIDYMRKVYNEGIFPLYRNIGCQLDTFSLHDYYEGMDAFKKCDEFGMKLKKLTLGWSLGLSDFPLEELVHSQQSKNIQSLTLIETLPKPVNMLHNIKALRCLIIDVEDSHDYNGFSTKTIDFSQLVEACPPTLTDLTIKGAKLTFDEPTANITSIRSLELLIVEITSTATITGTSFPQLSIFNLNADVKCELMISLPNSHLKMAAIYIRYQEEDRYGLSVNTMDGGKPQRTVILPTRNSTIVGEIYRSNKSTTRSTRMRMVEFTCASIENFVYSLIPDFDEDDEYQSELNKRKIFQW